MTHSLPKLPYDFDALEPVIGRKTVEIHYSKHHQTYVNNLNKLIDGTTYAEKILEEIILESSKDEAQKGIFNNAAQVWNHTFYWNCLTPQSKSVMDNKLLGEIERSFGSKDQFLREFKQACLTQFGSGWAWLVKDGAQLKIIKTSNADLPMFHGYKALLTCDVWEHAYYLDYQNKRADYVDALLNNIINWDFVSKNLFEKN